MYIKKRSKGRPMEIATCGREVCIQWRNRQQQKWIHDLIESVYGSIQNAQHMERGRKSHYNAFNLVAGHSHSCFSDVGPFFSRLRKQLKTDIASISHEMNKLHRQDRMKFDYLLKTYSNKCGLLGSTDRRLHISFEEIKTLLSGHNPDLALEWRHERLKKWIAKLDKPTENYVLSNESGGIFPNILLPGQKCEHHTNLVRDFTIITLAPLQSSMKLMDTEERIRLGLAVGLRCGASNWRWFDIFAHAKSPQKLLCFEVQSCDVLEWANFEEALQGNVFYPAKIKLVIPELFGGRLLSLFHILQATCTDCPDLFLYLEKVSVQIEDGVWVVRLSEYVTLHRAVDFFETKKPAPKAKASMKGKGDLFDFLDATAQLIRVKILTFNLTN